MNRIEMLKWLDKWLGRAVAAFLPSPTCQDDFSTERILFIRPGGIGDAVLLIPVIQALKEQYSKAKIDILAEQRNAEIFTLCPQVEKVFRYDKGDFFKVLTAKYDVIIDTEQWHCLSAVVARLVRSRMKIGYGTNERRRLFTHPVNYSHERYEFNSFCDLLTPLNVSTPETMPESFLIVPEIEVIKLEMLLAPLNSHPYVVLFPGASIPERRWGRDRFHKLAKYLNTEGYSVVIVGGNEDRDVGDEIVCEINGISLAGRTTLIGSAAVVAKADLLVSSDSGIMHVGVGLNIPTVSMFGSGIAAKWAPHGINHRVINKQLPCSPCTKFGYTPPCPYNMECLAYISVEDVLEEIMSLLKAAK